MVDSVKRYKKVIDGLVRKSFPVLGGKKIRIIENSSMKATADVVKYPFGLRLRVNPRARKYSQKELVGIFAHELCHLEQWELYPWDYYLLQSIRISIRSLCIAMERATDRRTIEKGYARPLYLQRLSRYKSKDSAFDKLKELYLSPEEIKQYAKEIGKW
jgi:hypothetical protein